MKISDLYDTVRRVIQDVVAPELQNIRGEISALRSDVQRVEETLKSEIRRVEATTDANFKRVDDRLSSLEHFVREAVDVRERLAALEAKVGR